MNLAELNNLLNSELTSKIKESKEENGELLINVELANIYSTILFLKTDSKCKFRQLIDILAVDFPGEEDRFKIYYLLLSHENNIRIKIVSQVQIKEATERWVRYGWLNYEEKRADKLKFAGKAAKWTALIAGGGSLFGL